MTAFVCMQLCSAWCEALFSPVLVPCSSVCRTNAGFLPSAFLMGLQPGMDVPVEVVIIAEDGVTSARYSVTVSREEGGLGSSSEGSKSGRLGGRSSNSSRGNVTYEAPLTAVENKQRGACLWLLRVLMQ